MHVTNELAFDPPEGLIDRTAHVLTATENGPSAFTVVITKNQVEDGAPLAVVVERIKAELARTLDDFRLLASASATVAGQPATVFQFQWRQGGASLFQKQAAFLAPLPEGPVLMQVAATATSEAAAHHAAGFDVMLAGMRLREPASA